LGSKKQVDFRLAGSISRDEGWKPRCTC